MQYNTIQYKIICPFTTLSDLVLSYRWRPSTLFPKPLGEMVPWTIWLMFHVALLDVNYDKDHPMESQDILFPIHPQFGANVSLHPKCIVIQRDLHSLNERMPRTTIPPFQDKYPNCMPQGMS